MATFWDELKLKDSVSNSLKKIQENSSKLTEKTEKMRGKFAKLQEKITALNPKITELGNKAKVATQKFSNFGGKVAKGLAKIGAAYTAIAGTISLVGGKILSSANKYADFGDRIDKMSQKIGMSRKAFQEWDYIMSQNGGNVESLQMGFKTLVTQMENVQKGSKDSTKAFAELGVKVKDNNGKFRSQDEVFNDTIKSLQKIQDPAKKAMLAQRLFGRSAAELKPLLNQEASAIDELRKKANDLGLIVTDEEIQNAVKFKDTMDTFSRVFEAKFAKVMMKLMPSFSESLEKIMALVGQNQEVFDTIGASLNWVVVTALPFVIQSIVTMANLLNKVGAIAGQILGTIASIPIEISTYWSILMTNVQIAFIKFKRGFSEVANHVKSAFANAFQAIAQFIQNIIDKIGGIIGKIAGIGNIKIGGGGGGSSWGGKTVNNTTNNSTTTNNYFTTPKASIPPAYGKMSYVPAH